MKYPLERFKVTPVGVIPDKLVWAKRWQEANEHLLALVPERWKAMSPAHQWEAIRIIRLRRPREVPEGFDRDYWRFLARVTPEVDYDDATEIMAMYSARLRGRRYESADEFMRTGGWAELFLEQLKPTEAGERGDPKPRKDRRP